MLRKRFLNHGYPQIAEPDAADASESAESVLRKTYWNNIRQIMKKLKKFSNLVNNDFTTQILLVTWNLSLIFFIPIIIFANNIKLSLFNSSFYVLFNIFNALVIVLSCTKRIVGFISQKKLLLVSWIFNLIFYVPILILIDGERKDFLNILFYFVYNIYNVFLLIFFCIRWRIDFINQKIIFKFIWILFILINCLFIFDFVLSAAAFIFNIS